MTMTDELTSDCAAPTTAPVASTSPIHIDEMLPVAKAFVGTHKHDGVAISP